MDKVKTGTRDSIQDHSELLKAAQGARLRASTTAELRNMVLSLEMACETARVAALRNVMGLGRRKRNGDQTDANCGFAGLFSALRRARAEAKRRSAGPARLILSLTKPSTGRVA